MAYGYVRRAIFIIFYDILLLALLKQLEEITLAYIYIIFSIIKIS